MTEEHPFVKKDADPIDVTREQVHSGVSIKGEVKRGTGTRDQDKLVIKGKGATAAEAAAEFEEALTEAETRNWADRLRALEADLEEGDDE